MKENSKHLGPEKKDASKQQLTTHRRYNRAEMLLIRERTFCRTRPDFLPKDFDNDDGLFSPDKWLQHKWICEGVENRVRRKAASRTSAGSGGGTGGSTSGNSTTATITNTPQDNDKQQQANNNKARLRRGTSSASNGMDFKPMDFKPDFQKSALEATNRPTRGNSLTQSISTSNNGGNGSSWSTATTSKQGNSEKSKIRRGVGERGRKTTERRRSSIAGEEPLPEWMDDGPESAFDVIELMGFEEDLQIEEESTKTEEPSSPENEIILSAQPMAMATSRLKQWMGEGTIAEYKGLADDPQKMPFEALSRCGSSNNASTSGGGSSAIGPPKQIQQHIPFYEPGLDSIGMPPMPSPAGFYPQQPMGLPYLPPSRSPQFPTLPPSLVNNNNPNIVASRSFLSSPVFMPNPGTHAQQSVHPLQMRHPFFGPTGPGGMGMPPMSGPGPGLGLFQHHVQQQQQPVMPPYMPSSRSPQGQYPPLPLVNSQISSSRSFINSPAFVPNAASHVTQHSVHPLHMRHPFFGSAGPGGMGMPPMPGPGPGPFHHHHYVQQQQQPMIPAHLPPSRSPHAQYPPPPPLVNSNSQISANRSTHFNQNYNLLNSPAFMPTSVMRQMSKVPGAGAAPSTGLSETGPSAPNPSFPTGRSNIPPVLEKIFASVRGQPTPDRSMLVRAILGQGHGPDDPSFSCSR